MNDRTTTPFLLTLALASTLLIVGCGSDDGSSTTPADTGSDTADAASDAGSDAATDTTTDSGSDAMADSSTDTGAGGDADAGADTVASPGTIPEVAAAAGGFDTLLGAVVAAGLDDDLSGEGPFTVFAPTDAAFAALPEGLVDSLSTEELTDILLYHVVADRLMAEDVLAESLLPSLLGPFIKVDADAGTVAGVGISATDIEASNGVIHVIDAVMLPPGTIPEVATEAGTFTTLLEAVTAAGLADDLSGDGPFTVFAPSDAAFADLPEGTLDSLSTEELTNILLYHVHAGILTAEDVVGASDVTMLNGDDAPVVVGDDGVTIGGASIVATDIPAFNGVIHVIDSVIIPEG